MEWPAAAIVIAVIASVTYLFKTLLFVGLDRECHLDDHQREHLWAAIELLGKRLERITPPEVSLEDQ